MKAAHQIKPPITCKLNSQALNLNSSAMITIHSVHRYRNHGGSGDWSPPPPTLFSERYLMLSTYYILAYRARAPFYKTMFLHLWYSKILLYLLLGISCVRMSATAALRTANRERTKAAMERLALELTKESSQTEKQCACVCVCVCVCV